MPRAPWLAAAIVLVVALRADASDQGGCLGPSIELSVGVGCDFSGFFAEALGLHSALRANSVCVRTPLLQRCEPELGGAMTAGEREMARSAGQFTNLRSDPDVEVRWHLGETWDCPWTEGAVAAAEARGTVAVLRSMTEKTSLSSVLLACCRVAHETWVPTEWHRKLYMQSGCVNVRALPEVVDDTVFVPKTIRPDALPGTRTTFLSVFQWQQRKGPDVLLRAYWDAFNKYDRVVLRIRSKVPGWAGLPFDNAKGGVAFYARRFRNTHPDELAPVEVIDDGRSETTREDMASLYRQADAFVLPSRGEGWCLPCAEAMASNTLLIASDFSGMTQYANERNSLPVRCSVSHASEGHCEPDVAGLAWRLRW